MVFCPIDQLEPHPHNPRGAVEPATVQELAASIKEKGILEPLIVVLHPEKSDCFRVIAGHRRLAGAQLAELETMPVIVRDYSPVEQEEIMLLENIQREDLSLLQEAKAYQRLITSGLTQMDVARKLGLNAARIQSRLSILKLTISVQRLFDRNELPITLAPLLTKIENLDRQERLANMVASRRLTVPKLKEMVDRIVEAEQTEAAVDQQRRQARRKKEPKTDSRLVSLYTRANALADLGKHESRMLSYSDLRTALEGVCAGCGMGNFTDICAACPLPQFINNLIKGETRATSNLPQAMVDARACA